MLTFFVSLLIAASPSPTPVAGLDPELTTVTYPYPVAFFALESQRQPLKMAYLDVAAATPNGKTVVLLHGKNFSAAYWADTIKALSADGFRVIAPDQIGFGKSSKPELYQFTFEQLADNTRALLDAQAVKDVIVVGHSMGGMLATRFALMFPERVARLVLVNPIGLEDWRAVVPSRTVDQLYQGELKQTPATLKAYMQASYFDGKWRPEYESLLTFLAGWTAHPDYPKVAWNAALTSDMVFTQPVVHDFARLRVPTLLIIGTRDRTAIGKDRVGPAIAKTLGDYAVLGKRAAAAIPGAELVELDGVGHLPQVEAWDRYLTALRAFVGR